MPAEFYILNHSFRHVEGISIDELEEKIKSLSADYTFIRENDEIVFRHDSIYDEEIYPNLKLYEFLYDPGKSGKFDPYVRKYLMKMIDHSTPTSLEVDEVINLLDTHNENMVYGLICLHKIGFINEEYLVYDRNDWFNFHRHFLGLYPISESHFYSEATKYFLNLYFHERIQTSLNHLEGGLSAFSKTIIRCLSALNDELSGCYPDHSQTMNLPETLRIFSSRTGISTTLEGNVNRKNDLTFDFEHIRNGVRKVIERICCEPHMKLERSDNYPGDTKYYYNRIYFHIGKPHIHGGRILVCHIGDHI